MITPNITVVHFNYCNIFSGAQLKKKVEGFFLVQALQISKGKENKKWKLHSVMSLNVISQILMFYRDFQEILDHP